MATNMYNDNQNNTQLDIIKHDCLAKIDQTIHFLKPSVMDKLKSVEVLKLVLCGSSFHMHFVRVKQVCTLSCMP